MRTDDVTDGFPALDPPAIAVPDLVDTTFTPRRSLTSLALIDTLVVPLEASETTPMSKYDDRFAATEPGDSVFAE